VSEDFVFAVAATSHVFQGVNSREDEAISVHPIGILGVEVHKLVEEDVSDGCHTHGHTRVAGVGLEGRINLDSNCSVLDAFLQPESRLGFGRDSLLTASRRIVLMASSSSFVYPIFADFYTSVPWR